MSMLARQEGFGEVKLHAPPAASQDREDPNRRWIKAFEFPEWFTCQNENCWVDYGREPRREGLRPRRLLHASDLDSGGHRCAGKGKTRPSPVQPIRFVRACRFGHIDDLDWKELVHGKGEKCGKARPMYWIDEAGTSGDLADVRVSCDCGKSLRMSVAAERSYDNHPLGWCDGKRPWLGDVAREACPAEPMKLLLRSASHAYFPQVVSVIHVPEKSARLRDAVGRLWEKLKGFPDAEVFAEIERRRGGALVAGKKLKDAEVEVLLDCPPELAKDDPSGSFYARTAKPRTTRAHSPMAKVDKVVLVHRLTEVRALAGFTRFEPKMTDVDGELDLGVGTARIDHPLTWLPAIENHGEGVFFSLKESELQQWESNRAATRGRQFLTGFNRWKQQRSDRADARDEFARPRYVLMHSLAHLLITAVSLECGYPASAIRERVYAGAAGSGVLLYTAAPGASGSLGGLVQVGRDFERFLDIALDLARLCSNDPVCAGHSPDDAHDDRYLEGASCHGCLLISEPSCERMNSYLDRTLVVPTAGRTCGPSTTTGCSSMSGFGTPGTTTHATRCSRGCSKRTGSGPRWVARRRDGATARGRRRRGGRGGRRGGGRGDGGRGGEGDGEEEGRGGRAADAAGGGVKGSARRRHREELHATSDDRPEGAHLPLRCRRAAAMVRRGEGDHRRDPACDRRPGARSRHVSQSGHAGAELPGGPLREGPHRETGDLTG